MDIERCIELFRRLPTIEILTLDKLREYLSTGVRLRHYIGYEISGFLHLGTGVVPIHKIVDLQNAGVETRIFLADYHSWINRKLRGDLDTIRKVATSYYIEAFKKVISALGGDSGKTKFILASEFYESLGNKYFERLLKISMEITLSRARRSVSILGRRMIESLSLAQVMYVPMQVTDIFTLGVNVAHGGIDQRKAHVIAIDVGDKMGYKPIALHHGMLLGIGLTQSDAEILKKAEESGDKDQFTDALISIKMSKSMPETAIFLHDDKDTLSRKIRKAYCPPKEVKYNPVVSLLEYVIYPYLMRRGEVIKIENIKKGGVMEYPNINEFMEDYQGGNIHPLDLKHAVTDYLIKMLNPVTEYFTEGGGRKYIEEMSEIMVTR